MEIKNEIKGLWKGFLRQLGGNGWGKGTIKWKYLQIF